VQATGHVDGDLRTPRLNVQEGAVLNGSIDMSSSASGSTSVSAGTDLPVRDTATDRGSLKTA